MRDALGRKWAFSAGRRGPVPRIDSGLCDTRHRQARAPALARRVPDGRAALGLRPRRQAGCRGLLGDVGRGLRAPLLRRPQRAARRWACRCSRSVTTSRARSSTRSCRSTTSCRRSTSTTPSSPRCRPPFTCSTASSRTRSRCGSHSRTSPSAARTRPTTPRPRSRLRLLGSGFTAEVAVRLQKLETGRSPSSAPSSSATGRSPPTRRPCARSTRTASTCMSGHWYVIGRDHDRDAVRTFRLDRMRGDVRFATRRERDFRVPPEFDPSA